VFSFQSSVVEEKLFQTISESPLQESSVTYSLLSAGGYLYAAGTFGVIKWDRNNWWGTGASSWGYALANFKGDLYCGGWFVTIGDHVSPFIAKADVHQRLSHSRGNDLILLNWDEENYCLQSASNISGPFFDITNAAPPRTNSLIMSG
jgi:hypothetical protein